MTFTFTLNGTSTSVDAPEDMPLLWVVRERLSLTGSKFGCGIAACGACTMQVDGAATRTCVLPISAVDGSDIRTIEGVGTAETPSAVQIAWL